MKGKSAKKPDGTCREASRPDNDMEEFLRWFEAENSRGFDKIRHKSSGSSSGLQGANQKCLTRKAASKEVTGGMGLSSISTNDFLNQCERATSHGFGKDQRKLGEPFSGSRKGNQERLKGDAKMQQRSIKHSTKRDSKKALIGGGAEMHLYRKRGANSQGSNKARDKTSPPHVKERHVAREDSAERRQKHNLDQMSWRLIRSDAGEKHRRFPLSLEFFAKAFQKRGEKCDFRKDNGPQKRTSTLLYWGIIVLDIVVRMIATCEVVPPYWYISIFDAAEKLIAFFHNDILSRLVNIFKGIKKIFVSWDWYKIITASCRVITTYVIAHAHFG